MVRVTLTAPVEVASGVEQLAVVALETVTPVQGFPSTVILAPERKPVPVRVIPVPPTVYPELGETEEIVGAGLKVTLADLVSCWPSGFERIKS